MGNSILSRNSSGGGAERIGDIRLSTRDSLGEKWVLADGRVDPNADNSDYVEPDFANAECWKANGPDTSMITYSGSGVYKFAYAENGIWFFIKGCDIVKYDMNTGITSVLVDEFGIQAVQSTITSLGDISFDKVSKNIVVDGFDSSDYYRGYFLYFDMEGNFVKKTSGPSHQELSQVCQCGHSFITSYNGVVYSYIYRYSYDVTYTWWIDVYADNTLLLEFNSWQGESRIYHKIVPLIYNDTVYMAFISPVAYDDSTEGSHAWWNGEYHHLFKVEGSELVSISYMTGNSSFDSERTSWDDLHTMIYGEGKLFVWWGSWSSVALTLAFDCEAGTITHPYSGSMTSCSGIYYWKDKIYANLYSWGIYDSISLSNQVGDLSYLDSNDPRNFIIEDSQGQYDSECFFTSKVDSPTGKHYIFNSNPPVECLPNIQIENTNAFIKVKE